MSGDRDQIKITRFMYSNQKKQDLAYCVLNSAPDVEKYRVRITGIVRAPTEEKATEVRDCCWYPSTSLSL